MSVCLEKRKAVRPLFRFPRQAQANGQYSEIPNEYAVFHCLLDGGRIGNCLCVYPGGSISFLFIFLGVTCLMAHRGIHFRHTLAHGTSYEEGFMTRREILIFAITAVVGLAVWVGIAIVSGKEEAWDSSLFFTIGLPVMLCASGVAGYIEPRRFWLWGIAVVSLQPIILLYNSEFGPLFMVGFFTFGVFAGLGVLGALVGAALRRQRKKAKDDRVE